MTCMPATRLMSLLRLAATPAWSSTMAMRVGPAGLRRACVLPAIDFHKLIRRRYSIRAPVTVF